MVKPENDAVAQVDVTPMKTAETVEAFSIIFEGTDNGADMIIAWDDTMVRMPIEL